jgi:hypothetical protein
VFQGFGNCPILREGKHVASPIIVSACGIQTRRFGIETQRRDIFHYPARRTEHWEVNAAPPDVSLNEGNALVSLDKLFGFLRFYSPEDSHPYCQCWR